MDQKFKIVLCITPRLRLDGEKNISTSRLKKRIAYYDWGQRPCSLTSFARTSCGHTLLPMRNKASHQRWFSNEPLTTNLASYHNCGYETKIYSAWIIARPTRFWEESLIISS